MDESFSVAPAAAALVPELPAPGVQPTRGPPGQVLRGAVQQ